MPTYIPGISASGTLAPGLSAATVRAVLELLSSAEIAASYLPLAGGTLTGGIQVPTIDAETIDATNIDATTSLTLDGAPVATTRYVDDEVTANGVSLQAYASNASNLTSGTVSDARLSANVARRDQANTFAANQNITGSLTTTDVITSNSTSGGFHIVNSAMRLVRNVASLLLENQNTGWPLDLSHGNGGTVNIVGAQGGLPTLGLSLTKNNRYPDVSIVRNATGPMLETRAAGGLKVCNADGSALGPAACSQVLVGGSTDNTYAIGANSTAGLGLFLRNTAGPTIAIAWAGNDRSGSVNLNGSSFQLAGSRPQYHTVGTTHDGAAPDFAAFSSNGAIQYYGLYHNATVGQLQIRGNGNTTWADVLMGNLTVTTGSQTAPSINFDTDTQTGFYRPSPQGVGIVGAGVASLLVFPGLVRAPSGSLIGWASGSAHSTNIDTNLSRASAGVVQVGTGVTANALGSLNLAGLTASSMIIANGGIDLNSNSVFRRTSFFVWRNTAVGKHSFRNWVETSGVTLDYSTDGLLNLRNRDDSAAGNFAAGDITASGSIRPGQFTVATLPSAAANTGRTVQVTDSSVDFPGNIGATVAGGGAFNVDVKSNGTNWRITG